MSGNCPTTANAQPVRLVTLANGDTTGLADAQTQAVAGKLNRERVWVDPGEAKPIRILLAARNDQRHSERRGMSRDRLAAEDIAVTARAPPPPAPDRLRLPLSATERKGCSREERLGDVRLYRIPVEVTVAARSQKQVALLEQPSVKVESLLSCAPAAAMQHDVERLAGHSEPRRRGPRPAACLRASSLCSGARRAADPDRRG